MVCSPCRWSPAVPADREQTSQLVRSRHVTFIFLLQQCIPGEVENKLCLRARPLMGGIGGGEVGDIHVYSPKVTQFVRVWESLPPCEIIAQSKNTQKNIVNSKSFGHCCKSITMKKHEKMSEKSVYLQKNCVVCTCYSFVNLQRFRRAAKFSGLRLTPPATLPCRQPPSHTASRLLTLPATL